MRRKFVIFSCICFMIMMLASCSRDFSGPSDKADGYDEALQYCMESFAEAESEEEVDLYYMIYDTIMHDLQQDTELLPDDKVKLLEKWLKNDIHDAYVAMKEAADDISDSGPNVVENHLFLN